ncbi:MAG: phosphatidylserine/phosphatidylglycerophosphate/cardiolipin synthase family protein, partial [Verrucomicrobiales bacterium]
ILDALAARAREGVRVQVIGDASSRFVPEKQAFDYLVETGVPVAEFNPVRGWRLLALPILLERDHRKFWVIDGRWVSLGGANINEPSLVSPEQGGNRDLMVTVESPVAAGELIRSFVDTWNESDAPGNLSAADFAPGSPLPNPSSEFWFFNQEKIYQKPSQTDVMMDGLFASAKKSIWLVEPYTFVNESILSDIRSMAGRGVEVNVVLSSQARAPRFRYASFYGIKDLSEAGAKVWIFDSETSPLHYKCALVDDALAYVGSSNLNLRSFHLSRELNTVFDDPPSVARVKGVIESVLEDCRLVPLEEAGNYRSLPFFTWWAIMQIAG